MNRKICEYFLFSSALILVATAVAKLYSAAGNVGILDRPDPILMLTTRQVFMIVGLLELALAAYLLFANHALLKVGLTALLASNFLMYRVGLYAVGAPKTCNCLGNLSNTLSISIQTVNKISLAMLVYLLIGSYGLLLYAIRSRNSALVEVVLSTKSAIEVTTHSEQV